ncbi:MAG: glycosyltransferase family 39 protein [Sulfuricella denitrificans]|nr:glycosyltransferase family 39 protein [Sulfuricella denitrificans]
MKIISLSFPGVASGTLELKQFHVLAATCLLCLAWLLPGLIGHDPWKPDEGYSFGLVYHILQSGDWVVPTLAGEPFMEKPPLYYLTAAATAWIFSPLLPLHDGARLASGFYMALTFLLIALSGRELYGRNAGWITALLLASCFGLLVRSHQLITDVSLLTGFATGLYGLALSLRRPVLAGLILGSGVGIGFMSKGVIAPGMLGMIALVLPLLFRGWRTRNYALCLAIALLAALPWLTIWPYALYQRSPSLFAEWLFTNNFGRFFGFVRIGPNADPGFYFTILIWYAWPALPLALLSLWQQRGEVLHKTSIQLPLTAFIVMLAVLSFAADARELYALPLLLPLSLLAATSLNSMNQGAVNAFYWSGAVLFTLLAGIVWLVWIALQSGFPEHLSQHLMKIQPGFHKSFNLWVLLIALGYTFGWMALLSRLKRKPHHAVVVWAAGITLVWGLLMVPLVSWLDMGKSYRSMIADLRQALPEPQQCIASRSLGEAQRAMLDYFASIITQREETGQGKDCAMLLVQGGALDPEPPEISCRKIWEGARDGDHNERFRLYLR